MLNMDAIRKDFPILSRKVNGAPLVYFDNGATTQKPRQVIEVLDRYYREENANIHRGIHTLSQEATDAYEAVRHKLADFIGAQSEREIIFTRGTTESINLLAFSWGERYAQPGKNIVVSQLEHHSNLIPWQMLAERKGLEVRVLPLTEDQQIDLSALDNTIDQNTILVSVNHMSNALGTLNDVKSIGAAAKKVGAHFLIDGAQSVPHLKTNVQELGCDFLAFSGHKMMGPTGIGVLYGREELLLEMPPFMGGGDMIEEVWNDRYTHNTLPYKFEAGTPHIAGVLGLGAALEYIQNIGLEAIWEHEQLLVRYALEKLSKVDGLKIYGPMDASLRGGIVSFNFEGIHPQDIGTMLDEQGIAIRTGHHCCQPLMRELGILGTARASFYLYNTIDEVDQWIEAMQRIQGIFQRAAARRARKKQV